jgi:hypothetical protein
MSNMKNMTNLQYFQFTNNIKVSAIRPYEVLKQWYILENTKFYNIKHQLYKEHKAFLKKILTKKYSPTHLFLIGDVGIGKMFTCKEILYSLVHMHNNRIQYDQFQLKELISSYTIKTVFNATDVTLHSGFYMPFNKASFLSPNNGNMDTMSKNYQQHHVGVSFH